MTFGPEFEAPFLYHPSASGGQVEAHLSEITFPPKDLIDRIKALGTVDITLTEIPGSNAQQISDLAIEKYGGMLRIDVSAGAIEQRAEVRKARESRKATITIIGDADPEGWFDSEDTNVLRAIDTLILNKSAGAEGIGGRAFKKYIKVLFTDPKNSELVKNEWNTYIVDHPQSMDATFPFETHHFRNVGIRTFKEGPDELRDPIIDFVWQTMNEVKDEANSLIQTVGFKRHQSDYLNTLSGRRLALGMAFLSNFVRGACYYRFRKDEKYIQEYEPRRLAAEFIDKEIDKLTQTLISDNVDM